MIGRDHIINAIKTHCRAESARDKDTWISLFARDIVIEDPVGIGLFEGLEALQNDFWANVERAEPTVLLEDEVIVCGNEAIAILSAEINKDGGRIKLSPIVANFIFDENGKIRRLRSFFNYG